jgi:hypothetical protein
MACGLPGLPFGQPDGSAVAPEATFGPSDEATEFASRPAPGAEDWIEIDPPPPAGIVDALQLMVDSGEWTPEEALVNGLMIFTGEVDPEAAFPQAPSELEGTGLVLQALSYLEAGTDEASKAEIERLLNIVAPDPERLLEYSVPAGAMNGAGVLARAAELQLSCEALWYDGFPSGQNLQCFQYKSVEWMGSTIRVFIPDQSDLIWGFQSGYADAAIAAVKTSLAAYSGFTIAGKQAVLDDVDIVFTLLESPEGDAFAMVPFELAGTQGCRTMIYPSAVQLNEENKPASGDFQIFEQIVAHEIFHCFTAWNYPDHWHAALTVIGTYEALDWWIEGAAEYFSNVVYPEVNLEWRWLNAWAYNSGKERISDMAYENFGFFQFLADKIGNNSLLSLFAGIPPSTDTESQAAGLAAYPNMSALFDEYARAYMDGTITDMGGEVFPTAPAFVLPEYRLDVTQPDTFHVAGPTLVLMRYGLAFHNDRHYLLQPTTTGQGGTEDARLRDLPGTWADLPTEVIATCSVMKYYYVMTTASPPAAPLFKTELVIDTKSDLACDQCLIGTWDLDNASFEDYSNALFAETPELYTFMESAGLWRYHFWDDGSMAGEFDYSYAYQIQQSNTLGNDIQVNGLLSILGSGSGTYASDGLSNLTMTGVEDNVVFSQAFFMGGEPVHEEVIKPEAAPVTISLFGGGPVQYIYACDAEADMLTMSTLVGSTQLPPLSFNRVSDSPLGLGQGD